MSQVNLTFTILGSGTSSGVPVPGCRCEVCQSHDPLNRRTRCSALLSYGNKNVLIDTATDLRQQVLREGLARIDAVLFTHTHADHVNGIDDLRPFNSLSGEPIPIYGSPACLGRLHRSFSYIFDDNPEPGYRPRLLPREIHGPFELFGQLVTPLPLRHGSGESLGYRIGPLAYLTDCHAIPAATEELLAGIEVLVIDALRFRPHGTHFNIPQALEAAAHLGARRTFLTHLSHDVEHVRDSVQLPAGTEFAYDGLRLNLVLP